jgi:hypothetical protein
MDRPIAAARARMTVQYRAVAERLVVNVADLVSLLYRFTFEFLLYLY